MAPRPLTRRSLLAAAFAPPPAPLFAAVPAANSGIHWVHTNARSPRRYLPESLGPGVAFVDYDNDGWPDILLVNSGPADFYKPPHPLRHALYRNNRDGTFTDVTAQAGIHAPPWTTSALWFDYNGDGLLDLFLCGFVQYTEASQSLCLAERGGQPGYCIPRMFRPGACQLYRNNGDGTFTDVSRETGIAALPAKALGAVTTDFNNDGLLDLFVANDTLANFLFVHKGTKFEDQAIQAMVAYSESGWPRSGMGVDSADINGDGWEDLLVANIDKERYSLYRHTRHGVFDDLSFAGEIGRATYNMSGWGCKFFDADNDGQLDLLLANGHPDDFVAQRNPHVTWAEPMLYFQGANNTLHNRSATAGPIFQRSLPARGLAAGDYNNDGRLDFLIGCNGAAPVLLKNNAGPENNWTGVRLQGRTANRDAIGARITWSAGSRTRSRLKNAGGSYLSSHDTRDILGLGPHAKCDWIQVQWPAPSKRTERFDGVPANRYTTLTEGEGRAV